MKKLIILLIVTSLTFSCSTIKVTSDMDQTVNFDEYKTFEYYGWAEESDKVLNRFDKERIEAAFGEEFKKRGLKYVEEDGDLVVSLFIVVDTKKETTSSTSYMGGGGYYGYGGYWGYGPHWGYGPGMGTSYTTYSDHEYEVGTLSCSVYDKEKKQLIWESVGTKTLSENPNGREERIKKAAAAIMEPYPVSPEN